MNFDLVILALCIKYIETDVFVNLDYNIFFEGGGGQDKVLISKVLIRELVYMLPTYFCVFIFLSLVQEPRVT